MVWPQYPACMSKPVTPADAATYLARWTEVGAHEVALAHAEPIGVRFKQLCALFDARHLFPADPSREPDVLAVQRRRPGVHDSG